MVWCGVVLWFVFAARQGDVACVLSGVVWCAW